MLPVAVQRRLYLAAVRLFWIDALQWHLVARPFLGLFRLIARAEDAILGRKGRGGAS